MADLKEQMQTHFLQYASYVIVDRAIPNVVDGLKPVQRRILETLWRQNDEKFHKVANIVGQSMQLHPHGDAPIYEALIHLANKGFLLDQQGNFGNIYTGDPAAAARYIETRLSPLARKTLFNPETTEKIASYDGRNLEPVTLPAKIPLLLMQGAEGIAVGMATHILPHNFSELLQAEIAYLEGKSFKIFPDFPTGGIMDKSEYDKGKGKVKLRAKIEIKDPKTLVIKEICYGTTTESLIRSIDEAAKKGKLKIESISDYTAKDVEIEIKLPRGQYAEELIDALYAFTECEVTLHSQIIVIKDFRPWETDIHEILAYNAEKLVYLLKWELELERKKLQEKIFFKTLERIFIEYRLYKKMEKLKSLEKIHEMLQESFQPFIKKLLREPQLEDRERLLQIPIRRISQFDIDRNKEEIEGFQDTLRQIEKHLKNVKKYAIDYLKGLIEEFGKEYPRKTKIRAIEEIDKRAISTKEIKIGFDLESGFVGTKVTGALFFHCTNFDKLLLFSKDGQYRVVTPSEKYYVDQLLLASIADKKELFHLIYQEKKTGKVWAKSFVVEQFILEKVYRFFPEGMELCFFGKGKKPEVEITFSSQTAKKKRFSFEDLESQKPSAKGKLIFHAKVRSVKAL